MKKVDIERRISNTIYHLFLEDYDKYIKIHKHFSRLGYGVHMTGKVLNIKTNKMIENSVMLNKFYKRFIKFSRNAK